VDDKKSLELRLENLTAELNKGKGLLADQEANSQALQVKQGMVCLVKLGV